jgi:MFS family permease
MLASINAVAAEFSNAKKRSFAISTMAIGYPVGGVVGGLVVSDLLREFDWRIVFYFGAGVTVIFIPLVYFFMPESVHWLARKQPEGALDKINATMKRLGHSVVDALPDIDAATRKLSTSFLFSKTMVWTTILVTTAYFLHVITLYYILKWTPKLVVDMGFAANFAGEALTWASLGGALGCIFFGILSIRFSLKSLTIFTFVMAWIFTAFFGRAPADLGTIKIYVAMAGFFTNAGIVGMYAILAQVFPAHARASGTGFAVGIGRGGSVLSPIIAGYLLEGGLDLPTISIIMGAGSVVAAIILLGLKMDSGSNAGSTKATDENEDEAGGLDENLGKPAPA